MLLATLAVAATLVTRRGSAPTGGEASETPITALLSAGHGYTPHGDVYCPACMALADTAECMSDEWPEGCSCKRDAVTGARDFGTTGDIPGVALTGVRQAADRNDGALRYAAALADRADAMAGAAGAALFFGDKREADRCMEDSRELSDLSDEALEQVDTDEAAYGGASGCNLDTLSMLDDETGRWAHEKDAWFTGATERGEGDRLERPLASWEQVGSRGHLMSIGFQAQARAGAERAARYRRLANEIRRSRTMERKAMGRWDSQVANQWRQRAFAVVSGAQTRYKASVQAATSGESPDWSKLYLTKQQMSDLWALNDRRVK